MKSTGYLFSIGFLLVFINIYGQSKKPMSIIDFLNIPSLSDPQLSPDGNQLLYVLHESNWKENHQVGHIWRKNINNGDLIKLTNGDKTESSPRWSPDGKNIAFIAQRPPTDKNQIYMILNQGGEAWQLTNHKPGVRRIYWAPDGKSIYFLANDPKTKEEEKKDKLKDDVYAYDENYKLSHLWRIGIEDSVATRITEGNYSINNYQPSRDGKNIVVSRGISPLFDESTQNEIWLMDKDGQNARQLTDNNVSEFGGSLSPDGKQVLFGANANENFDFYYNDKVFVLPASGGDPKLMIEDLKYEVSTVQWTKDGKGVYLLLNMGIQSQLFKYTLFNKNLKQITNGDHSITQWRYNPVIDQHVFGINSSNNPGDIHLLKGDDVKTLTKLTNIYDYLETEFKLHRQEKVSWQGNDGVTVEGLLYYPIDYVSGRAYPLVVQTHGGPASSDKFGFSRSFTRYNAVLAAKGYIVLQPNYRGSTGYGDDFLRDMVGSYFRNSHLDVMAGVDYLISRGLADPDKLVKMGWSAGGHMTNKLITFTDRFKAASSGAGAINWISMYGQSDVRIYRTPWFGGTPWQENAPIDTYWENSPLKDISKVKTPTLVMVGANDVRVPLPQSLELYRALKRNGVPTHLYVAPREPHGWRELRHRLYKINVELSWFAKYALGKEYEWEIAPGDKKKKEEEQ